MSKNAASNIENFKSIVDHASHWEDLEGRLLKDSEFGVLLQDYKFRDFFHFVPKTFLPAYPSLFPPNSVADRETFSRSVRYLYSFSTTVPPLQPHFPVKQLVVDDVGVNIYPILHDESELQWARQFAKNNSYTIAEAGFGVGSMFVPNNFQLTRIEECKSLLSKEYFSTYLVPLKLFSMIVEPYEGDTMLDYLFREIASPLPASLDQQLGDYVINNAEVSELLNYGMGSFCAKRSIAQMEHAISLAKQHEIKSINLIVGTMHAYDMQLLYSSEQYRQRMFEIDNKTQAGYYLSTMVDCAMGGIFGYGVAALSAAFLKVIN